VRVDVTHLNTAYLSRTFGECSVLIRVVFNYVLHVHLHSLKYTTMTLKLR